MESSRNSTPSTLHEEDEMTEQGSPPMQGFGTDVDDLFGEEDVRLFSPQTASLDRRQSYHSQNRQKSVFTTKNYMSSPKNYTSQPNLPSKNQNHQNDLNSINQDSIGVYVTLQIWDTAGQERFRSLPLSYFRKADAVIFVYDITDENSLTDLIGWSANCQEYMSNVVSVILANKVDILKKTGDEMSELSQREYG